MPTQAEKRHPSILPSVSFLISRVLSIFPQKMSGPNPSEVDIKLNPALTFYYQLKSTSKTILYSKDMNISQSGIKNGTILLIIINKSNGNNN